MRDHPQHCTHMLAGLFGVKLNQGRRLQVKQLAESMFSKSLKMNQKD